MFNRLISISIFFFFLPTPTIAQAVDNIIIKAEIVLVDQLKMVVHEQNHAKKMQLNDDFANLFLETLQNDAAFDYPFDSLKHIGKVQSQDKKVRLFTWNIPQPEGTQKYFGFLVHKTDEGFRVIRLYDSRQEYEMPHSEEGTSEKWFGALYYELVDFSLAGRNAYILLGADLNNNFSSKRIIDVLTIDGDGLIHFGKPIFKLERNMLSRVIFEYSSRATMVLRWDRAHGVIVCSHLIPMQPGFTGNFQYYVPDLSYDGFKLNSQIWEFIPDIDIRNPTRKRPTPVKSPTLNYDPGFLYKSGH